MTVGEPLPMVQQPVRTSPTTPLCTSCLTTSYLGRKTVHSASVPNTPASAAASEARRAGIQRERLLYEDALAGVEGQRGVAHVHGVRGGDVHHVHAGVSHERPVVAVRALDPLRLGEPLGARRAVTGRRPPAARRDRQGRRG